MAGVDATYLVDKSALARMTHQSVADRMTPLIKNGEVATCAIIELEVLYSARTFDAYQKTRRRRELVYEEVALTPEVFERALDIQERLAADGHHRIPIPDVIIAAAAERESLTILHYDSDFDTIAAATGQDAEWVVPQGSL